MIIETAQLSPIQKATIEELLGQTLREKEAISVRALPDEKSPEQKAAADSLIGFLKARQTSRPSVSDEELEAATLEAIRSERPHFRSMP